MRTIGQGREEQCCTYARPLNSLPPDSQLIGWKGRRGRKEGEEGERKEGREEGRKEGRKEGREKGMKRERNGGMDGGREEGRKILFGLGYRMQHSWLICILSIIWRERMGRTKVLHLQNGSRQKRLKDNWFTQVSPSL
ncbi:Protein argonaute-2, partial [Ophiophagus hannah]